MEKIAIIMTPAEHKRFLAFKEADKIARSIKRGMREVHNARSVKIQNAYFTQQAMNDVENGIVTTCMSYDDYLKQTAGFNTNGLQEYRVGNYTIINRGKIKCQKERSALDNELNNYLVDLSNFTFDRDEANNYD